MPKHKIDKKKVRISFLIPEELFKQLLEYAKNKDPSQAIEEILMKVLNVNA